MAWMEVFFPFMLGNPYFLYETRSKIHRIIYIDKEKIHKIIYVYR